MLETLREFGLEQLEASGEQEMIRRRHANFFLALAEQAEASLESAEQVEWMNRMEQEHDNLRAALEWSKTAEGAAEICLRLAGTLGLFWEARGYFSEGRERLAAILLTESCTGTNGCTRQAACQGGRACLPAKRLSGDHIICRREPGNLPRDWGQARDCLRAHQAWKCSYGGGRLCGCVRVFGRGADDLARAGGQTWHRPRAHQFGVGCPATWRLSPGERRGWRKHWPYPAN